MEKRVFSYWLESFKNSINEYGYYIDFEQVCKKTEKVKVEINILNSLVGSEDIENEFDKLLLEYPKCLNAIPILLAVREKEIYCQDEEGEFNYCFDYKKVDLTLEETRKQYAYFMEKTGLFELISSRINNNLYDYIIGVETGLNSNARKNRGGHQMERLVESFIKRADVEYYKEMYLTEIEDKWNVDLSAISNEGTTTKRWDFVVKTNDKIYVVETNFYTSGGSKLNETSRSYRMIAEETKQIDDVEFIWITDGGGWKSAARNLEETFNSMDYLFNINDMENGELIELFSNSLK